MLHRPSTTRLRADASVWQAWRDPPPLKLRRGKHGAHGRNRAGRNRPPAVLHRLQRPAFARMLRHGTLGDPRGRGRRPDAGRRTDGVQRPRVSAQRCGREDRRSCRARKTPVLPTPQAAHFSFEIPQADGYAAAVTPADPAGAHGCVGRIVRDATSRSSHDRRRKGSPAPSNP